MHVRLAVVIVFLWPWLVAPATARAQARPASPEVRAVWVDAFHAGIRSPAEAAQLVADAKRLHLNTLIVQVRRRGDALYTGGLEPPLDDPNYDPSFDALAHIVTLAHDAGLQVHAWINAMPVWRDEAPPKDARHLFNRHGPAAAGDDNWLTSNRAGVHKFPVGYFLDPGHPAVQNHLVAVYTDIVRRYGVDGIHFDYIRYPETEGAALPRGSDVGYNAVSVSRFQRATGRRDVPAPDEDAWIGWRQQQVTQLVRRISAEVRAINPRIKVGAATIAWGRPPATRADFYRVSPTQRVFQDWRAWLAEGLLDMAVPMNYAREHDQRVRTWFDGWIAWEKRHKADRHLVVGVGGYLSAADGVLAQMARARAADGRFRADGVSLYSYNSPASVPPAEASGGSPAPSAASPAPDRFRFLVNGAGTAPPAFTGPAPVPTMPWIERPTEGWIAGRVTDTSGVGLEAVSIGIRRTGLFRRTRRVPADANGWFGAARLKPGTYRVRLDGQAGLPPRELTVTVTAGAVTRADLIAVPRT